MSLVGVVSVDVCVCVCVCVGYSERERRLEARNTALQITAEQLEKKIQLKV